MAGLTLAQAEAQLATWIAASTAVGERGQAYAINSPGGGGRTLTRANLREIRDQVEFWDRQVKRLSRGGIRGRLVTPV